MWIFCHCFPNPFGSLDSMRHPAGLPLAPNTYGAELLNQFLFPNAVVIVTKNESGMPDQEELHHNQRFHVVFHDGHFFGFRDHETNIIYRSCNALVKANLKRHGLKNTQRWKSWRHVVACLSQGWTSLEALS